MNRVWNDPNLTRHTLTLDRVFFLHAGGSVVGRMARDQSLHRTEGGPVDRAQDSLNSQPARHVTSSHGEASNSEQADQDGGHGKAAGGRG